MNKIILAHCSRSEASVGLRSRIQDFRNLSFLFLLPFEEHYLTKQEKTFRRQDDDGDVTIEKRKGLLFLTEYVYVHEQFRDTMRIRINKHFVLYYDVREGIKINHKFLGLCHLTFEITKYILNYRDGILEGPFLEESRNSIVEAFLRKGKFEGHFKESLRDDLEIMKEGDYVSNKKTGFWVEKHYYHANFREEGYYKNDKKIGPWYGKKNGKTIRVEFYK